MNSSYYVISAYSKPMSKRAKMEPMIKTYDIPSEERTSNTTDFSVDDINNINSVGLLNIVKTDGSDDDCTASVIRTNNGNIAITAAHCLYDHNTQRWNEEFYFFPGYNNGEPGNVGKVTGYRGFIWSNNMQDMTLYDYGFIKFYYQEGRRLQEDTGAFDYDLDIPGDNYPTTVFGYPSDGEMDCPRDGQHLCEWEGLSFEFPNDVPITTYRGITIDVGNGASGGPWIRNYEPKTKTGNVMGVSYGILPEPYPDETAAWTWTRDDFTRLLYFAEHN